MQMSARGVGSDLELRTQAPRAKRFNNEGETTTRTAQNDKKIGPCSTVLRCEFISDKERKQRRIFDEGEFPARCIHTTPLLVLSLAWNTQSVYSEFQHHESPASP